MLKRSLTTIDYIMGILMLIITIVIFTPIILRAIFNYSIVWSDEIALLSMIWLVYLGVAACYLRREHIEIDILYNLMPTSLKWLVDLFGELLMFCLFIFLIINSYNLTLSTWGQVLPASGISNGLLILPLFIGSVIMAIYILTNIIKKLRKRNVASTSNEDLDQISNY